MSPKLCTVETRIKVPIFVRIFRLILIILNLLNKNHTETDIGGSSYISSRCHVFRIPQNFQEFLTFRLECFSGIKRLSYFSNNSNFKVFSRILKEFSKSLKISCFENSNNVRKASTVKRTSLRTLNLE